MFKPIDVMMDASGQDYLVADTGGVRIPKCSATVADSCTTVAGSSRGSGAEQFDAISLDASGNYLICDGGGISGGANSRIQKCSASLPLSDCTNVAGGAEGSGLRRLNDPSGIETDPVGGYLIADRYNHRVQKCSASLPLSDCTAVAGDGSTGSSAARLHRPYQVIAQPR